MRIAIPTNDMTTVSAHFGRSKGFMVFNIENDKVTNMEYRINNFTGHAKNKHKEHNNDNHRHSHESIFNALRNCNIIIAGGMGKRLYNDFNEKEIEVYVTNEKDINKALELLIKGVLDNNTTKCCSH